MTVGLPKSPWPASVRNRFGATQRLPGTSLMVGLTTTTVDERDLGQQRQVDPPSRLIIRHSTL